MTNTSNKIPGVYSFEGFGEQVLMAYSGREFDLSGRQAFLDALNIPIHSLKILSQAHTNHVVNVTLPTQTQRKEEGDALITNLKGVALGMLTADCVPLTLCNAEKGIAGIVHAGWKGLESNIISKTIEKMQQEFKVKAASLSVHLGPFIRKCCYEVGPEFRDYFPGFYQEGKMDMTQAARDELINLGIREENIRDCGICTACDNSRFFSARRESGSPNRMLSLVMLRP